MENKSEGTKSFDISPNSDQLIQEVIDDHQKYLLERKKQVELVKQNTGDKEFFSIEALLKFYSLRDDDGELRITPEMTDGFEAEYYLKYPEAKTVEEFADRRKEITED